MKKIILLWVVGIFLISLSGMISAENCDLAIPRYGVVQCVDVGEEFSSITLTTNEALGSYKRWSVTI